MTVEINSGSGHGSLVIDITGSASTHDLGNILNPEGVPLAILESTLYIVSPGLANCDLHIGVGAASAGVAQNDVATNFPVDGSAGDAYACTHPTAAVTQISAPAIWRTADAASVTATGSTRSPRPAAARVASGAHSGSRA